MINKTHTLFGAKASRVSTEELETVYNDIFDKVCEYINGLTPTRSLPCKKDHGDIDLVYMSDIDIAKVLSLTLGEDILESSRNGDVYSILYHCAWIDKNVHVDFIKANADNFQTKLQYFMYNDFSGIVGMMAKKLHFKYGSEGFFKRFRDKRGNWHDILISYDLKDGLKILGFDVSKFDTIQNYNDIVSFVLSSPMFDSKMVTHTSLNQSDKKSYKRPVIKYVVDKLREADKRATITDEDYLFELHFNDIYNKVCAKCKEIDSDVYVISKYNGNWVMREFGLASGPLVGIILKELHDEFGSELDTAGVLEVKNVIIDVLEKHVGLG